MPILKSSTDTTGSIKFFGGTSSPFGYIICDGSVVSRTTYAALFAAIGTTFNTGGELGTQFRLPDLRGKTTLGAGQDTGRSLSNRVLGTYAGAETVALAVGELPGHTHGGTTGTNSTTHTHPASMAPNNQSLSHSHSYSFGFPVGNTDNGGGKASVNGNTPNSFNPASIDHSHSYTTGNPDVSHNHTFTTSTGNAGTGGTGGPASGHQNIHPHCVAGFYIKY